MNQAVKFFNKEKEVIWNKVDNILLKALRTGAILLTVIFVWCGILKLLAWLLAW